MYFEMVNSIQQLCVHVRTRACIGRLRVDNIFTYESSQCQYLLTGDRQERRRDVLVFGRFFFFPLEPCSCEGVSGAAGGA